MESVDRLLPLQEGEPMKTPAEYFDTLRPRAIDTFKMTHLIMEANFIFELNDDDLLDELEDAADRHREECPDANKFEGAIDMVSRKLRECRRANRRS